MYNRVCRFNTCININFRLINERCYYYGESKTNFQDAKTICKGIFPKSLLPGRVFEGRSIPDQEQVFRATKSIEIHRYQIHRDFWIGMNDNAVEGEWRYDSDNTLVPNWALPNLRRSRLYLDNTTNCAYIRRENSLRGDIFCTDLEYFICEESFMDIPEIKGKKKQIMKLMTYDFVMT